MLCNDQNKKLYCFIIILTGITVEVCGSKSHMMASSCPLWLFCVFVCVNRKQHYKKEKQRRDPSDPSNKRVDLFPGPSLAAKMYSFSNFGLSSDSFSSYSAAHSFILITLQFQYLCVSGCWEPIQPLFSLLSLPRCCPLI